MGHLGVVLKVWVAIGRMAYFELAVEGLGAVDSKGFCR